MYSSLPHLFTIVFTFAAAALLCPTTNAEPIPYRLSVKSVAELKAAGEIWKPDQACLAGYEHVTNQLECSQFIAYIADTLNYRITNFNTDTTFPQGCWSFPTSSRQAIFNNKDTYYDPGESYDDVLYVACKSREGGQGTTYQLSDRVSNLVTAQRQAGTNSWSGACPDGYERITTEQECRDYLPENPTQGNKMFVRDITATPGCGFTPQADPTDNILEFNKNLALLPNDLDTRFLMNVRFVCKLSPITAGAGGDPHIEKYHHELITYQGICDVLFLHSPDGADGLGFAIQARLTAPKRQKTGQEYTYISEIAVSIGGNVYEVQSEGAKMFLNGVLHHDHTKDADDTSVLPTAAPESNYTLTKRVIGERKHRVVYTFRFANGSEIELRANTHFRACFVEVRGDFGGTKVEGLLGNPQLPGMFGRDGRLMPKDHVNEYGQEWQVLDTEPHLFVDAHRYPQYPVQCIVVDLKTKDFDTDEGLQQLRGSRRNLIEVENGTMEQNKISELEAKEACGHLEGLYLEYCVNDVIAFGELEMAEDPFYHKGE